MRRPKITDMHDFMGNVHFREATTISATLAGIEHMLNFSMGQTTIDDSVDIVMIKIITGEEVVKSLRSNTASIIMSEMRGEFLGLKIGKDVTIPRMIQVNGD